MNLGGATTVSLGGGRRWGGGGGGEGVGVGESKQGSPIMVWWESMKTHFSFTIKASKQ